jgi:hypothetical protein
MGYLRTNREGLFFHTLGGGNSLAFVAPSVGARMLFDENFSSNVAQSKAPRTEKSQNWTLAVNLMVLGSAGCT